jgi:hypothetical protein
VSGERGTTLCSAHARQAARELVEPSGPCRPAESWRGGNGREVRCDVVAAPERVAAYLSKVRAAVSKFSNRASVAPGSGSSSDAPPHGRDIGKSLDSSMESDLP